MTIVDRTPSQPRTVVEGAATPLPAVANNADSAARRQTTDECYRIAASLAHRPGS